MTNKILNYILCNPQLAATKHMIVMIGMLLLQTTTLTHCNFHLISALTRYFDPNSIRFSPSRDSEEVACLFGKDTYRITVSFSSQVRGVIINDINLNISFQNGEAY